MRGGIVAAGQHGLHRVDFRLGFSEPRLAAANSSARTRRFWLLSDWICWPSMPSRDAAESERRSVFYDPLPAGRRGCVIKMPSKQRASAAFPAR
jgi:hypothetical protein